MDVRERFGQNVRRLRVSLNLSQEELAFRAGVHRTYCSDIERAIRNPSISVVQQFADALGVKAGSLLE